MSNQKKHNSRTGRTCDTLFACALTIASLLLGPVHQVKGEPSPPQTTTSPAQEKPRTVGDTFREAERAFASGDFDRVIKLMNSVITTNVDNVIASRAIMARGNAYGAKGDADKAMTDLDEALKLNPQNSDAYRNRGVALFKKGDTDGAMKDLSEAIRINPRAAGVYLMRAKLFEREHNQSAALEDLGKMLEINPNSADAYAERAAIYLRNGENEKALSEAERAIQIDPNGVLAFTCRLHAFTRLKRYQNADKTLQAMKTLQPKDLSNSWNSIAWFRATCPDDRMRNGREAVETAKKACDLSQWTNLRNIDTLAAAYAEMGEFDQAVTYQNRAIAMMEASADQTELRERLALYQQHKPYREELKP